MGRRMSLTDGDISKAIKRLKLAGKLVEKDGKLVFLNDGEVCSKSEPLPPSPKPTEPPGFDRIWQAYPRKTNKMGARRAWKAFWAAGGKSLDENAATGLIDTISRVIEVMSKSEQWQNPKYIPHAATFINQRRWEDEESQALISPRKQDDGERLTREAIERAKAVGWL